MLKLIAWKARQAKSALRNKPIVYDCNLCGFRGWFEPQGGRASARCRRCNSFERHRLFGFWLDGKLDGKRVLHFALEPIIRNLLKDKSDYVSADVMPGMGDKVLNIEAIDEPDDSYDAIICLHVLEHVDDRRALAEMRRILRPGGQLVLMFPIVEGWASTYENDEVDTDAGRLLHFGQEDHVRYYGSDVRERIRQAGFSLAEHTAEEPLVSRHGLARGQKVFVATA